MSLGELLRTKSSEYELLAERGTPSVPRSRRSASSPAGPWPWSESLSEIAEAIDGGWGEDADPY